MATKAEPDHVDVVDAVDVVDEADSLGLTTAGSVMSGGVWTALGTVLPPLQVFVISIVAARFLGASGFGRQSLIAFVSLSFATVFAARMPAALSRFGAQLFGAGEGGAVHWLFRWTWRVQLISAALIVVGFTLYALVIGATPQLAWIAAGAATALAVLQNALGGLLASAQRWRESIMPGTILTLVACVVMVGVFAAGGGISGYFFVEVGLAGAGLVWTWRLVRPLQRSLPEVTPISSQLRGDFRSFMRTSTFFALIEFVVLSRVEVLFLNHYSTSAQVGFYSVAFAASAAVARIPNVITIVAIPAVASLYGAGEHDKIRGGYWRALRLLAAVCPILVALGAVLGSALLGIAYGPQFHAVKPVLALMLVPYLVLPMMGLSTALLWTLQRMRFLVISGTAAVVVDIVLGFVLIPRFHAIGAAIDNDLALLTSGIPALWLVGRLLRPSELDFPIVGRALLVAVIGGVFALAPVLFLPAVPGFVVALVASALATWLAGTRFGMITPEDAEWLSDVLADRLGGRLGGFARRFAGSPRV
jgi:O-antigen/teichoic acid export membrane protein